MSMNIHDAKTHFSRIVARVADGETVVISRAGQPVAQVTRVGAPPAKRRIGFLADEAQIPADFDRWGADDVETLFGVRA